MNMPSHQQKHQQAESLIIGGCFAGAFAICLAASSAWSWIGGFSLWGLGEVLRARRRMEYAEVFKGSADYLKDAIADVSEISLPLSRSIEQQKQQIAIKALKQLPMGERLAEQFISRQGLTTDWFQGIEKRSSVVCGESADGKSFLLQWRVMRFLQQHPDGEILICDPDYGSSHEGSAPNNWFGLPVGKVVQIEGDDITGAIHYVSEQVSDRARQTAEIVKAGKTKPTFPPLLLVIDEWGSYWDALEDKNREMVLKSLTNITNRGIKQGGVTFILGLHDLSVGSTGLNRATLRKLEVLLLWRAAQSVRNYDNLEILPAKVQEVAHRMGTLPKSLRDRRPCVVWTDKALEVRALPHLELSSVEFVSAPNEVDSDQAWLTNLWTPEFELRILSRMIERQKEGKGAIALTEFWCSIAQQPQKEQVATNPKYVLFRHKIEQLGQKFQDAGNPGSGKSSPD